MAGMSESAARPFESALDLRRAFDAVFAASPPVAMPMEDMLAIGLDGVPYAVRLTEVAGVFRGRRVVLLPGRLPEFIGVAGIQGRIVPVYDLRRLMGHPPAAPSGWLLLVLVPHPLGLAFDAFAGQLRVTRDQVAAAQGARTHVRHAVAAAGPLRHLVDIASVVEAIGSRVRQGGRAKEY
jgi:purine-binding chemotaxis protein CheW